MNLNKIAYHEPDFKQKTDKNTQKEVFIPEKVQNLVKYNKNVDESSKVTSKTGANLNYNA